MHKLKAWFCLIESVKLLFKLLTDTRDLMPSFTIRSSPDRTFYYLNEGNKINLSSGSGKLKNNDSHIEFI